MVDPTIRSKQVLERLRDSNTSEILIVYDGLETIDDLTGLLLIDPHIHTIVTTKWHSCWELNSDYNTFYIDKFERAESIRLLLKVSGSTDEKAANKIADFLDDLPLAVNQAAFAARRMRLTSCENSCLSKYSKHLMNTPTKALRAIKGSTYSSDTLHALEQAAHFAMNSIDNEEYADGMRILMAMAYLSKSGVPTKLLIPTESLSEIHAYEHLINTSIITSSKDHRFTYIHTLQGAAIRNYWNKTESDVACATAGTLLFLMLKSCLQESNFPKKITIARNIIGQLAGISQQTYSTPVLANKSAIHCLLSIFPLSLELNVPYEVIQLEDTLNNAFAKGYINRRDYYITIGNLANCYLAAELPENALHLYQDALHNLERLLDPSDVNILALRAGLARSYTDLKNYEEAKDILLSTLVELTSTLRANDSRTLRTRSYLATCFLASGDYQSARDQYELIYSVTKDRFGENSRETLTALNSLAMLRSVAVPSESLHDQVEIYLKMVKILGIDHHHCITMASNITYLLERNGRIGEACALYEQVLKKQTGIFGSEHRDTLRTRTNLASAYLESGDAERALALLNDTPLSCHTTSPSDRSLTDVAYEMLEAAKRELKRQEEDSAAE